VYQANYILCQNQDPSFSERTEKLKKYKDLPILLLQLATAANFLSPVSSRFGQWERHPSGWESFIACEAQLNSFAPERIVPILAIASTVPEIIFSIMSILGFKTRIAASGAASLTFVFAMTMTYSFGVKLPLNYGVRRLHIGVSSSDDAFLPLES